MLAVINSKLINWYHLKTFYSVRIPQGSLKYPTSFFEAIPYVDADTATQIRIANIQASLTSAKLKSSVLNARFKQLLASNGGIDKIPTRIGKWWLDDFNVFVKSLKIKLSLQQKDELIELFEKYRADLLELDKEIQKNDDEIDQLIYELYGLSDEEITIIEAS